MLQFNKIARSLCAVMLCLSVLLPRTAVWADTEEASADSDVYAIDIEFGNLSFYYDFGVWNTSTMRYEASAGSTNPAEGTENGFPGWYGFDGIANLVRIKNTGSNGQPVTLTLSYRSLTEDELSPAGVPDDVGVVSGVSMSVYWNGEAAPSPSVTVPVSEYATVGFLHLSGEPTISDGQFSEITMTPIGMLTITIESWE